MRRWLVEIEAAREDDSSWVFEVEVEAQNLNEALGLGESEWGWSDKTSSKDQIVRAEVTEVK